LNLAGLFRRAAARAPVPQPGAQARWSWTAPRSFWAASPYLATLSRVHANFRPRSYLEIGTLHGDTLKLASCASVAIDPEFKLKGEVKGAKPLCLLEETTSDAFFATRDPRALLGGPVDLAFIDGMHHVEFALRDFFNCERASHPGGMILLHDLCPRDAHMTRRMEHLHVQRPTNFENHWTATSGSCCPSCASIGPT
jgi:hypothetical protein